MLFSLIVYLYVRLKIEKVEANKIFNDACEQYYTKTSHPKPIKTYDAKLKLASVSHDTATMLINGVAPYCRNKNPEPVFLLADVKIKECDMYEGEGWQLLSFDVTDGETIPPFRFKTFNKKWGTEINGFTADVYFSFPQVVQ